MTLENLSVNTTYVAYHCKLELLTNGNPANLIEHLKIFMAHVFFSFTSHACKPDFSYFAERINLIQTEMRKCTFMPFPYTSWK
jgi:hypothetical protein